MGEYVSNLKKRIKRPGKRIFSSNVREKIEIELAKMDASAMQDYSWSDFIHLNRHGFIGYMYYSDIQLFSLYEDFIKDCFEENEENEEINLYRNAVAELSIVKMLTKRRSK